MERRKALWDLGTRFRLGLRDFLREDTTVSVPFFILLVRFFFFLLLKGAAQLSVWILPFFFSSRIRH